MASKITAVQRKDFLKILAEGDKPEKAARAVGTTRRSFLRLRQEDEAFALAYDDAYEAGMDMIEQRLVDIAKGADAKNPQVMALLAVLNARRSEFYRRNVKDDTRPPKVPSTRRLANLDDDDLRQLERILARAEHATKPPGE